MGKICECHGVFYSSFARGRMFYSSFLKVALNRLENQAGPAVPGLFLSPISRSSDMFSSRSAAGVVSCEVNWQAFQDVKK